MLFSIQVNEAVPDAARRIASEQINAAISALDGSELADSTKAFALRRRCKKLRALLRLVRDGLADESAFVGENAQLRDIARGFSVLRDADMLVDAYDSLTDKRLSPQIGDCRRFGSLRRKLTNDRQRHLSEIGPDLPMMLEQALQVMEKLKQSTAGWRFKEHDSGFELLEGGVRGTYRRALQTRGEASARPTVDRLHRWRKQVKYHRNHLRILKRVEPAGMAMRIDLANVLSDLLGTDHDIAILRGAITNDDYFGRVRSLDEFIDLIDQRRRDVQMQALHCSKLLFAERPGKWVHLLRTGWDDWHLQPMASKPAASNPAASNPAASNPAASNPAASNPAASNPTVSRTIVG